MTDHTIMFAASMLRRGTTDAWRSSAAPVRRLRSLGAAVLSRGNDTASLHPLAAPSASVASYDGSGEVVLVTGATGKVGSVFIKEYQKARPCGVIRALCNNRMLPETERQQVVKGSIGDRSVVEKAMSGVTHVVHLATVKETPDLVMDVTVKGMFMLLEAAKDSPTFEQFMLIGGDAAMGHFFYDHPSPVTEAQKWSAYPGCYALSKVLEECMLEQYYIQYDLNGCCLMAPWIMEKDDFRYSMSFGDDLFGGPAWGDYVNDKSIVNRIAAAGAGSTVPLALDAQGEPLRRNFVHVEDLVSAMLAALGHPAAKKQKFNICMDEPVDYGKVAAYLQRTKGVPAIECKTEWHSTWLDNSKAKFKLGWRPIYDAEKLIDSSWAYKRSPNDPRVIYYPG